MNNLPKEPPLGLLMSMAMRYDHAIGCPGYYDQPIFAKAGITHAERVEGTLTTMRQIYEEVPGNGFYSPEKEDEYVRAYDAACGRTDPKELEAAFRKAVEK